MNKGKFVARVAVLVAVLVVVGSSEGAVISNFEPPTYTANTNLVGQDGWSATPYGTIYVAKVTPATGIPEVLADTQSAVVLSTGYVTHPIGATMNDGWAISWLAREKDGNADLVDLTLFGNITAGETAASVALGYSGKVWVFAKYGGIGQWVNTGVSYSADTTYALAMTVDFTNQQFSVSVDGNSAGTYNFAVAITPSSVEGIGLHAPGYYGIFDNIQVVPEPATLGLLVSGGFAVLLRRRQKV